MAQFLDNLGLGAFTENEEDFTNLIWTAVNRGKPLMGYYGNIYFNHHIGWVQLIVPTETNEEKKAIEIIGLDTHADGDCRWQLTMLGMDLGENLSKMECRCIVGKLDEDNDLHGMAVVNIVNADVLPSFARGETYTFQVIAFATDIHYYSSAAAYDEQEKASQDNEDKSTYLIGEGAVLPMGFLKNHMVKDPTEDIRDKEFDPDLDDIVLVRGVVKRIHFGYLEDDNEDSKAYLRCIIGTTFGDLEIDHSFDAVCKEEFDNLRVGATVVASVVLSADAANYGYENGIVRDEDNNLKLMRYTFMGGDPERIRIVLAEDAEYQLDSNGKTYVGKDAIIERLRYVQDNGEHEYFAYLATITEVEENDNDFNYPVGTRCVVLASDDKRNYESIAFISMNEEGYITKIYTCMDNCYHFKCDTYPE